MTEPIERDHDRRQPSRWRSAIEDDRGKIEPDDKVLLIVEDDPNYGRILLEMAHEKGLQRVVAQRGTAASRWSANSSRTPSRSICICRTSTAGACWIGLKVDLATRHIPVHIITVDEDHRADAHARRAWVHDQVGNQGIAATGLRSLKNFIERPVKNLLLVEDDEIQTMSIRELIGNGDVKTTVVTSGKEALEAIQHEQIRLHGAGSWSAGHVRHRIARTDQKHPQRHERCRSLFTPRKDLLDEEESRS